LDYHPSVLSTNETLKNLLINKTLPEGYTVTAGSQDMGKGRKGSDWASPQGGLWFSCYFRPELPVARMPLFSVVFSVAMMEAVRDATGAEIMIQWPNDLYCRDVKICGMLLEFKGEMERTDYLILGAGLYVNRQKAGDKVHVSLSALTGREYNLNDLLITALQGLETAYVEFMRGGFQEQLQRYKTHCRHWRKKIQLRSAGRVYVGQHADVDDSGFLILEDANHMRHRIVSGDIQSVEEME
jgi:BirA family biotin operon repressor/biotin-[acetyl-CoA-carboxylase] ligase